MAVDYHEELISLLSAYTVYYEKFDKEKTVPCITYLEVSNPEIAHGDTLAYSDIDYQLKIWGSTISEVQAIFVTLDLIMREAGFTRTFALEGTDEGFVFKTLRYNGTGYENEL